MIELRELITDGQIFTQKPVKVFDSEYDIIQEYGLTLNEIEDALKNKKLIRNRYLLELMPAFIQSLEADPAFSGFNAKKIQDAVLNSLRDAAINEVICHYGAGMPRSEIETLLGVSDFSLRQIISRAFKKLGEGPAMKKLLYDLLEYHQIKNRRTFEARDVDIVRKTKITITMKD
jgi:hypothetical protein